MNKAVFILSLAVVVLVALLWRSCNKKPISVPQDKIVDSLNAKLKIDSIKHTFVIDSFRRENLNLELEKDSLAKVVNETKFTLHQKGNSIQDLIDRYNFNLGGPGDRTANVAICDSLVQQVTNAKALVFLYENQSDSLQKVLSDLSKNKDTIISHLDLLYTSTNQTLFEVSRQYHIVSDNLKKAQKNENRRFGIGPEIGIGIGGNKIGPYVGIGVHYNLFKF